MDGEPTVQEYLNDRETDIVALGFELNGATGKAWDPFLNKVSREAHIALPTVSQLPFAGTGTSN